MTAEEKLNKALKTLDNLHLPAENIKLIKKLCRACFKLGQETYNQNISNTEESPCCGAGTYGDHKICEACGEHC